MFCAQNQNIALDLDPKDRHQIKAIMDKLHNPVTGDDETDGDDDGILHDSDIDRSSMDEGGSVEGDEGFEEEDDAVLANEEDDA